MKQHKTTSCSSVKQLRGASMICPRSSLATRYEKNASLLCRWRKRLITLVYLYQAGTKRGAMHCSSRRYEQSRRASSSVWQHTFRKKSSANESGKVSREPQEVRNLPGTSHSHNSSGAFCFFFNLSNPNNLKAYSVHLQMHVSALAAALSVCIGHVCVLRSFVACVLSMCIGFLKLQCAELCPPSSRDQSWSVFKTIPFLPTESVLYSYVNSFSLYSLSAY